MTETPAHRQILPSEGNSGGEFGHTVAISEGKALIGAPFEDTQNGSSAGTAYIYKWTNGEWRQQAILIPNDGKNNEKFGWSVAIDGDRAVVGAKHDHTENEQGVGAAYLFERTDGGWERAKKFQPPDAGDTDLLGWSVAIDGDHALVGAPNSSREEERYVGAAYLLEYSDSEWTQVEKLELSDGQAYPRFVRSVAIERDTIMVGADRTTYDEQVSNAVYVFERAEDGWSQQRIFESEDPADGFGESISLTGETALIGAWKDDVTAESQSGTVHVLTRSNGDWSRNSTITAEAASFGWSVSTHGDWAVVGAPRETTEFGSNAGSAYVFRNENGSWIRQGRLLPESADAGDDFGSSVSISGRNVLVGSPGATTSNGTEAGSAYVFSVSEF